MPAQALAAFATLLAVAPHGNRYELQLDRGSAEIVWVTGCTFRFRRALEGPLPESPTDAPTPPPVEMTDSPAAINFRTKYLDVEIRKDGALLTIRKREGGPPLTADLTEPREAGTGVEWERLSAEGAQYYGLGPRTELTFELRGKAWPTDVPFLMSTAGYGESHQEPGAYRFDFTAADRYRIRAPAVDYLFHYGPRIKQILEIAHDYNGDFGKWRATTGTVPSWAGLRAALLHIVHGAMSGMLEPTFDLAIYNEAPEELRRRARQLGSLVREVSPGVVGLSDFRKQLSSFLLTYAAERDERGFPLWHPLPFQFPDDPECMRHADEFMFGDEILVAPIYEPGGRREVYLPQGVWTNLETNEVFQGRRTITVQTESLPVFARNGMIVPLDSPAGIALHYFPRLAAEFFILEEDMSGWTQVHASYAVDVIRLEIESKKTRDYQWVVHHIDKPTELEFEGKQLAEAGSLAGLAGETWFYDKASRNLHARVSVREGEDRIVNVVF